MASNTAMKDFFSKRPGGILESDFFTVFRPHSGLGVYDRVVLSVPLYWNSVTKYQTSVLLACLSRESRFMATCG